MIGLDEVGRGAWAGPLLVAAVQINTPIDGLKDSKKISAGKRILLSREIKQTADDISFYWIDSKKIDEIGLSASLNRAFERAFLSVSNKKDDIYVDGNINYLKEYGSKAIIRGDDKNYAIAAASIVAKVARDAFMQAISEKYADYGFADHVGYGTKKHIDAIAELGVLDIHRKSYGPIKKALNKRANSGD